MMEAERLVPLALETAPIIERGIEQAEGADHIGLRRAGAALYPPAT